jgi:selenium-binding protein 1
MKTSQIIQLIPFAALAQCLNIPPFPQPPVSLPPLIPSIPGVTVPLNDLAPPLPILQVPTPALDSPPFTASDIKPKKIGYFWTGAGDRQHKDFLATYSLDDVGTAFPSLIDKV